MYYYFTVITSAADAREMVAQFKRDTPTIGAFDTEATGLHIVKDLPFLFQFGWIAGADLRIYCVELDIYPILGRQVVQAWNKLAASLVLYLAQNTKFDLNMLHNYAEPYEVENLSDTQFYIRYGHDALSVDKGGPPLGMKQYCAQYIDRTAKEHEHLLNIEKTAMASMYNRSLRKEYMKGWTAVRLDKFFKDPTTSIEDLNQEDYEHYMAWFKSLPDWLQPRITNIVSSDDIRYDKLNRVNLLKYAMYDIVWVLRIFLQLEPIVKQRCNENAILVENSLILPLLEMERVGFRVDKPYLMESRTAVQAYIRSLRATLYRICGAEVNIGQHAKIKAVLADLGVVCVTTNAEELSRLVSQLRHMDSDQPAVELIDTIQELRTLEKWYATYILRFLKDLERSDHIYTQINQVGTVSVRVTSDFQQFPKDPILTRDGVELFHPRKMILVEGGDYDATVYLDYSQIELRVQAMYTILCGHPEPNLIRAYAPYNCINVQGELYDCHNLRHTRTWDQPWFLAEAPDTRWTKTDVHGVTTTLAFNITPEDPNFDHLRYIGKRLNFAKNYGAGRGKVAQMFPEYSDDQIDRIDAAYYLAFPGVKHYHDYCYRLALQQAYATNLFGVRYYGVSGHNLINILIQGSSASFLKWKIRQNYDYRREHHIKSMFQMNIHDEMSWCKHKEDSLDVFYAYKRIMEDWPDTLIPIVAEMEITYTNWAEKKKVK